MTMLDERERAKGIAYANAANALIELAVVQEFYASALGAAAYTTDRKLWLSVLEAASVLGDSLADSANALYGAAKAAGKTGEIENEGQFLELAVALRGMRETLNAQDIVDEALYPRLPSLGAAADPDTALRINELRRHLVDSAAENRKSGGDILGQLAAFGRLDLPASDGQGRS